MWFINCYGFSVLYEGQSRSLRLGLEASKSSVCQAAKGQDPSSPFKRQYLGQKKMIKYLIY